MQDSTPSETPVVGGFAADRADASTRVPGRRQPAAKSQTVVAKTPTLLLFVLLLTAGAGALFYQQREMDTRDRQNEQLREALSTVQAELAVLSQQVNRTGESLNETGSVTEQKLGFLDSEVRKLWAVSNERNKKAIAAQEAALKGVQQELRKQDSAVEAAQKEVKSALSQVKAQAATAGKLSEQVAGLEKSLQSLQAATAREKESVRDRELALQTRVDQVSAQMGALGEQVRQAVQRTASFDERLQTNQQDVRAMDSFRQQTVRALTTLQATVNEIQQDLDAMKRVY